MASAISNLSQLQRVRLLYKTVLRLHRGLPVEFKAIGDQYVKDEFRRHKTCQPKEADVFMAEWVEYAVTLSKQLGVNKLKASPKLGLPLNPDDLSHFRDEQISQLYELMQEAKKPHAEPVE